MSKLHDTDFQQCTGYQKLHKTPYKSRFIANSSSCTTTKLSKLLTSCLIKIKEHVQRYCDKTYENSGLNLFWSIKNSNEILTKLEQRKYQACNISTYDFSTLYTTLPHNLIKTNLYNLLKRLLPEKRNYFWRVILIVHFLQMTWLSIILCGLAPMSVNHYHFFWIIFMYVLGVLYIDKLLVSPWVQTARPLSQTYFCTVMRGTLC